MIVEGEVLFLRDLLLGRFFWGFSMVSSNWCFFTGGFRKGSFINAL